MSATIQINTSLSSVSGSPSQQATLTYALSSSNDLDTRFSGLSVDAEHREARFREQQKKRLTRRLKGFFIQDEGESSRVAFVDGESLVHYCLPSRRLKDAGIKYENQPFEMDEYEAELDGITMKGYKLRPSAEKKDAKPVALDFDEDRQKKLDRILAWKPNSGG